MLLNKNIVIFSPQPWNHIYVSKHHYALALAKQNNVWFISAPEKKAGAIKIQTCEGSLHIIHYNFWLPERIKFKMPYLYKKVLSQHIAKIIARVAGQVDVCIDFGCYQFFDNLDFIDASHKIFFPVDDRQDMKIIMRGADHLFSVSANVLEKFRSHGVDGTFINHGLSESFAAVAKESLIRPRNSASSRRLRVAYSGNLFIPFLDIAVLEKIISAHPLVEFHLFGSIEVNKSIDSHVHWWEFLNAASNVRLRGFVNPEQLSNAYDEMDAFLLCYKPDYRNYHAENSHKVLEYMSTGKVLVSTYLSIYWGNELIKMSPKDMNHQLPDIFSEVLMNIEAWNSPELEKKRIEFALQHTYKEQLARITEVITKDRK